MAALPPEEAFGTRGQAPAPGKDFCRLLATRRCVTVTHYGEKIVENLYDTITPEMKELALEMGWKQFFFTNRLQLQLQLRRRRRKQDAQNQKTE